MPDLKKPRFDFDRTMSTTFCYVERMVLVLVGGLALLAVLQILLAIPKHGEIRLEDLLLIFIFLEIMAMANVYFVRQTVPFTYPMFIAVTALSRLIVLQGKSIDPENLLFEGGAIVLVSIGILILRYSQRFTGEAVEETRCGGGQD
ncbi:MAG: phosphate-starvation-inducible E [Chromatiaceae bacterium]|nr:MAG: phosphate-starvation-inducible E [Chromatiaceae bacterium]